MARTRNESGYRHTTPKDGRGSFHLGETTTSRIFKYCSMMNINKTKFVEQCVNESLDKLETEYYESLDKETLIRLLREKK